MGSLPRNFRDSANSKIGTYEAFLDLLTLLCFIFIFSTVIFIERYKSAEAGGASNVVSRFAVRGAIPAVLPDGEVAFKIERSDGADLLTILDSVTGTTNQFNLSRTILAENLQTAQRSLTATTNITISVFEDTQPVSSDTIVAIQRWLTYNGYGNYKFYFVGQR